MICDGLLTLSSGLAVVVLRPRPAVSFGNDLGGNPRGDVVTMLRGGRAMVRRICMGCDGASCLAEGMIARRGRLGYARGGGVGRMGNKSNSKQADGSEPVVLYQRSRCRNSARALGLRQGNGSGTVDVIS